MSLRAPPADVARYVESRMPGMWAWFYGAAVWALGQAPAVRVTSWYRDPAENARANGHPTSAHLLALGIDATSADPQRLARAFEAARFPVVVPEGSHVHAQAVPTGYTAWLLS